MGDNNEMNGKPLEIGGNNEPEEKNPSYWTSPDKKIAVKLDMMPGDIGMVALAGANSGARACAVFWYPDGSVTILGCQPKEGTIQIMENALESLRAVPDQ